MHCAATMNGFGGGICCKGNINSSEVLPAGLARAKIELSPTGLDGLSFGAGYVDERLTSVAMHRTMSPAARRFWPCMQRSV